MARRYFGSQSPIGQSLTLTIGQHTNAFRVGAVVAEAPAFHDFNGSVFVRITRDRVGSAEFDHWDKAVGWTFLHFPDSADARRFEAQLPAFLDRHGFPTGEVRRGDYTQSLRPIATVHQYLLHDGAIVVTLGLNGTNISSLKLVFAGMSSARASRSISSITGGARRCSPSCAFPMPLRRVRLPTISCRASWHGTPTPVATSPRRPFTNS